MNVMSEESIKTYGCITKTAKCKYLKVITVKDIQGIYRSFYTCVSEEKLCCSCCKDMEKTVNAKD